MKAYFGIPYPAIVTGCSPNLPQLWLFLVFRSERVILFHHVADVGSGDMAPPIPILAYHTKPHSDFKAWDDCVFLLYLGLAILPGLHVAEALSATPAHTAGVGGEDRFLLCLPIPLCFCCPIEPFLDPHCSFSMLLFGISCCPDSSLSWIPTSFSSSISPWNSCFQLFFCSKLLTVFQKWLH